MTPDQSDRPSAEAEAWEAHKLSQLRHFRSLTLRQKLEAVEAMADVVRHIGKMRAAGGFAPAGRRGAKSMGTDPLDPSDAGLTGDPADSDWSDR